MPILQLIINKKYLKIYFSWSWEEITFHFFFWHLCFAFTLSDFSRKWNSATYWQGITICWDWISEWVDGREYSYAWEVVFQEISQYELRTDNELWEAMSGIL